MSCSPLPRFGGEGLGVRGRDVVLPPPPPPPPPPRGGGGGERGGVAGEIPMNVLNRFRLSGRRALVTGGSRGLGRAVAQAFAEAGADLVLVGRDSATLQTAQRELAAHGRDVQIIAEDVGTPEGARGACERALAIALPIDILVNN